MRFVHAAALIVVTAACGRDAARDDTGGSEPDTQRAENGAQRATISDAEALGVLRAIGDAEISAARIAEDVSLNSAITGYARVVAADHRGIAALIDSTAARIGLTPRDNVISTTIRLQGDSVARGLSALASGFNNTFLEEQVRTYQQTVQLLDTLLIPAVRDSSVKNLLSAVRPTFAAHMQRAMQLLAQRRRETAERGEEWISGLDRAAPAAPAPTEEPDEPRPQPARPPAPAPARPVPAPDTTQPDTVQPDTAARTGFQNPG